MPRGDKQKGECKVKKAPLSWPLARGLVTRERPHPGPVHAASQTGGSRLRPARGAFHSALPDAPGSKGAVDAPLPRGAILLFSCIPPPPRPTPTPATWRAAAEEKAPAQLPARPVPAGCGTQTRACPLVATSGAAATPCLLRHFLRGARHVRTPPPSRRCAGCEGEADSRRACARLSF